MKEEKFGELVAVARNAAQASYSPHSKFRVGAAVRAGGKIYGGTNIENASYGLAICAERVAIFAAIADGNTRIDALAVACVDASDSSSKKFPCGACRQVISEFAAPGLKVAVDTVGVFSLDDLLPLPFRL